MWEKVTAGIRNYLDVFVFIFYLVYIIFIFINITILSEDYFSDEKVSYLPHQD